MTLPIWQVLLLTAIAVLLIRGMHALAWRVLRLLTSAVDRLPQLRQTRTWALVRAWLRLRYRRLHLIIEARVRPKPFNALLRKGNPLWQEAGRGIRRPWSAGIVRYSTQIGQAALIA